jgi:hypothetical protein
MRRREVTEIHQKQDNEAGEDGTWQDVGYNRAESFPKARAFRGPGLPGISV